MKIRGHKLTNAEALILHGMSQCNGVREITFDNITGLDFDRSREVIKGLMRRGLVVQEGDSCGDLWFIASKHEELEDLHHDPAFEAEPFASWIAAAEAVDKAQAEFAKLSRSIAAADAFTSKKD